VTDSVHSKMVRRHPHVFGNAKAANTADVLQSWEAIKAEEKRAAGKGTAAKQGSILDGVRRKLRLSWKRISSRRKQREWVLIGSTPRISLTRFRKRWANYALH